MTDKRTLIARRSLLTGGAMLIAGVTVEAPFVRRASAAPVTIRYATGGGIGPNEMETVIFLDWMQKNGQLPPFYVQKMKDVSAVEKTNYQFNAHAVEVGYRYRAGARVDDGTKRNV